MCNKQPAIKNSEVLTTGHHPLFNIIFVIDFSREENINV
jgi:hypothetical protein